MTGNRDQTVFDFLNNSVLQPDETVVWTGRPDPKAMKKHDLPRILFGCVFLLFALFFGYQALNAGAGLVGLVILPMIAAGWVITARARKSKKAERTYYAVTDQRVLILIDGDEIETTSISPDDINDYARKDAADGSGSIQLRSRTHTRWDRQHRGRGNRGHRRMKTYTATGFTDGLWGLTDVAGAAAAIDELRSD